MIEVMCFDLGDALIAEETVIHDSCGWVLDASVAGALPELSCGFCGFGN